MMDRKLIERLATEAEAWGGNGEGLDRFAALVAEECAKVCDGLGGLERLNGDPASAAAVRFADRQTELCASAIREKFA